MSLNPDTHVSVCCYAGDMHQVQLALNVYRHHETPLVVFSPADSPAILPDVDCLTMGKRAYIGQDSLDRQRMYLETLLTFRQNYFLMHDSDSLCLSAKLPAELYYWADRGAIYSNEVTEPRPHKSPYPKLAFQPPYFFSRASLEKMLSIAGKIKAHHITPYIDWQMVALCCEAGLGHIPFTSLEHAARTQVPFTGSDPWEQLAYRIKFMGTAFVHPIKTPEQLTLCLRSRKFYEDEIQNKPLDP